MVVVLLLGVLTSIAPLEAMPASYKMSGRDKGDPDFNDRGVVLGWIGCENVPMRLQIDFVKGDWGQSFTIDIDGDYRDTSSPTKNKGIDYMADFSIVDASGVVQSATIAGNSLPWAAGSGTGTTGIFNPNGVEQIEYLFTITMKPDGPGMPNGATVYLYFYTHLALSPNGAAEWGTSQISVVATPPSGGVKTVNIKKPETAIATTTTTTTNSRTSTTSATTSTAQTTSTTEATTETSVTNPTTTRVMKTTTLTSGSQSTTYTSAATYTTSWTRSTTTQLVGTSSTSMTVTTSTILAAVLTTTTWTTVSTVTGSTTGGTVYMTVVTKYEVRVDWFKQLINGVMTWITHIYHLIFEIKVDPTVDQTIIVVEPTTSTTTTTTTPTTTTTTTTSTTTSTSSTTTTTSTSSTTTTTTSTSTSSSTTTTSTTTTTSQTTTTTTTSTTSSTTTSTTTTGTTATSTASITTPLTGSTTVFTTTYVTTITSGRTTYTTTVTTLTTSTYGTRQLGSGYVGGVTEPYNPLTTLWPYIVLAGWITTSLGLIIRKRRQEA